jgi:twinkle protein
VVITEGELDRMSISQAFDNKWPTGSLPNGAGSAKKAILADYEKLCRFDSIVLCFDNDEPGQKALKEACELLPVGKVKIMSLPKKDANAVLMDKALGPAVLVRAFWDATPYRPDGIREGREFTRERMKQTRKAGLGWSTRSSTTCGTVCVMAKSPPSAQARASARAPSPATSPTTAHGARAQDRQHLP